MLLNSLKGKFMSVIFTWLDGGDNSKKVFIDDDDYQLLNDAFTELESKSGVFVDQYSDTRLSPDHACILVKKISDLKTSPSSAILDLLEMLKSSVENSQWILILGD